MDISFEKFRDMVFFEMGKENNNEIVIGLNRALLLAWKQVEEFDKAFSKEHGEDNSVLSMEQLEEVKNKLIKTINDK